MLYYYQEVLIYVVMEFGKLIEYPIFIYISKLCILDNGSSVLV